MGIILPRCRNPESPERASMVPYQSSIDLLILNFCTSASLKPFPLACFSNEAGAFLSSNQPLTRVPVSEC
ncbi:hypothetical protein CY34DRAFT_801453 [Suillus luteus UH-Slu-Lm8-n1]|uniref:Uncharacterized protein n=1 Tax=Suillus luteus UH-Slu-Lm8-n1 TaxID=930992 RepID=A0A0D0BHI1_9AGAM|nr:hypothetical protein CY34DRAFT_801453 [Suillus luteus UH-Slu-Lm8-n1]